VPAKAGSGNPEICLSFLRKQESRKRAWKLKIIEKENPQWVDLKVLIFTTKWEMIPK